MKSQIKHKLWLLLSAFSLLPFFAFSQQSPIVEFDFFMESVGEDVGSVVVHVVMSEPATEDVYVYVINEVSSNASIGYDFEMPSPYELVIPAGSTSPASMTIYITDDDEIEGNEAIMLAIESTVGGNSVTGLEGEHVIWIEDNDECDVAILNEDTAVCQDAMPIALSGNPSGGMFEGEGVIGNVFYPQLCPPGEVTIQYTINESLCEDTASKEMTVKLCTSISDGASEEVEVYPSIVSDFLNVSLPSHFNSTCDLRLIDSNGRLVYQEVWNTNVGRIDVSSIPGGVYNLLIQNGDQLVNKRIIKQ